MHRLLMVTQADVLLRLVKINHSIKPIKVDDVQDVPSLRCVDGKIAAARLDTDGS